MASHLLAPIAPDHAIPLAVITYIQVNAVVAALAVMMRLNLNADQDHAHLAIHALRLAALAQIPVVIPIAAVVNALIPTDAQILALAHANIAKRLET